MELIQYGLDMMDTTPTALKVISRVKGRDSDGIWWNTWQKPSQLTDILGLKPSQIPKCSRATPVRFSASSVSLLCPDLCPLTAQFWWKKNTVSTSNPHYLGLTTPFLMLNSHFGRSSQSSPGFLMVAFLMDQTSVKYPSRKPGWVLDLFMGSLGA